MPPPLHNIQSEKELNLMSKGIRQNHHGNMISVGVTSEGTKPVGAIGLKKAEKELIMRRYKYHNQHPNDNINRVAVIYGQTPQYNSHDRGYMNEPTQASSANYSRGPGAYYNMSSGAGSYMNNNNQYN